MLVPQKMSFEIEEVSHSVAVGAKAVGCVTGCIVACVGVLVLPRFVGAFVGCLVGGSPMFVGVFVGCFVGAFVGCSVSGAAPKLNSMDPLPSCLRKPPDALYAQTNCWVPDVATEDAPNAAVVKTSVFVPWSAATARMLRTTEAGPTPPAE